MGLSSAAIAKQNYYNRQAKKGKITQAQARSMGAPLSSKISTPARRTTSSSGNNIAADNNSYTVGGVTYQTKQTGAKPFDINNIAGVDYGPQILDVGNKSGGAVYSGSKQNSSKAPSKKSTPINTTQRKSAANAQGGSGVGDFLRNLMGVGSAGAYGGDVVTKPQPTLAGRIVNTLASPGKSLAEMLTGNPQPKVTDYMDELGLSRLLVNDTPVGMYNDPTTMLNQTPQEPTQPAPYNDWASFNQTQGNPTTNRTDTRINTGNNRNPQPVSNPTQTQPTSDISSIVKALIEYQVQPDNTPVQNNESTRRQLLGNGYFSNGIASNGKGDYGIQGTMGNNGMTDQTNPMDDLLSILGLKTPTAQAQEMPQTAGFGMPQMSQDLNQNNWMGVNSFDPNTTDRMVAPTVQGNQGNVNQSVNQTQQPQVQQGGGVAQQFAQGSPSQMQQGFDSSGYKSAQKAQKKALDELIKSIKSQYAQSTTEGTTALEKSKQEDLLKLSGLFNFANQDPNSEQRIQYEQRSRNDYAGQLKDFLSKLATGQSQDISGAKQGYQSKLADILTQQSKDQQDYQNQMWDRNYKMASLNKGGGEKNDSLTYLGDNAQGEPVYWNNRTKQQQVGTGLKKPSPSAQPQLKQDENGDWYYET